MSNDHTNDRASNGPSSNFFNKLRMKVALLATPKAITPEQFFALIGLDTTSMANKIVERYYQDLINDHVRQFVNAMSVKNYADLKPDVINVLVSANSSLNDMQKAKIGQILGDNDARQTSYLQ